MRQVPLERYINIAVNGCSGFATSTRKGPFTAMLISRSGDTCLISFMLFWEHGKRATPLPNKASVVARRISGSSPPPDKLVSATPHPIAALYASIFYLKFIATESSCSHPEISSLDCSFDRSFIATMFSLQICLRGVTRFPVAPSLLPLFQFPVNMQRPAQNNPDQ